MEGLTRRGHWDVQSAVTGVFARAWKTSASLWPACKDQLGLEVANSKSIPLSYRSIAVKGIDLKSLRLSAQSVRLRRRQCEDLNFFDTTRTIEAVSAPERTNANREAISCRRVKF